MTQLPSTTWDAFIGGRSVPARSGERFETLDPATGRTLAQVARGRAEDVDDAVRAAAAAAGAWARRPPVERGRTLSRIADALRAEREQLALIETLDNGKPLTQARRDVDVAARYFEFYGGGADKLHGETIPLGPAHLSYTLREPFGVSAQIIPWNAPLQQAARGIAPALAAGNVVVAKPAEDTSLTCLELARIAVEQGLPEGVFNVVTGLGEEAGAALVAHPDVAQVVFTGSVPTGRVVMHAAAERLVPLTLELGGKSPNVVFADADLDRAARMALVAINMNAGQVCSAGSRLLVAREIHDELVERLVALQAEVTLGPGVEDPRMGPLTTRDQLARVREYLTIGVQEGATVAIGGGTPPADERLGAGWFVQPTIFTGVDSRMRIAQEEIFGPVLSVIPFDGEADAIRIANDTRYGLVAGVWTRDLSRAHRVASRLVAGQVFVNDWFAGGVETPFGGTRESGFGREKGFQALEHYTQVKNVTVRLDEEDPA